MNMYERMQHRTVVQKQKSAVDADSKKGGTKRPKNICREVKGPPREQAPEPTYDEVPLKIHSPLEERGNLRESVNYRKQDHSMVMKQREIACYDVKREAHGPCFWTFFHEDWYHSVCQSKKKPVINMQWHDWDFIEKEKNNCPAFIEVIDACEHHGIKDVMTLKYD
jgi:hypothetical protein